MFSRDFLPREPVSPLFGGMKQANMGVEFQIKQEYTGQGTDLCYLVSQWKYYLDFDMLLDDGAQGVPTTRRFEGITPKEYLAAKRRSDPT